MASYQAAGDTHHVLPAELRRLLRFLERAADPGAHDAEPDRAADPSSPQASGALAALCDRFALTPFERDVLVLAAGVEVDPRVGELCAVLNGHPRATFATFGAACTALPDPHWSALTPDGSLRRYRLLTVSAGRSFMGAPLRLEERVLHYLAGSNALDPQLQPLVREVEPASAVVAAHRDAVRRIVSACRHSEADWPVVQLWGDDAESQVDVASAAAGDLGLALHVVSADDLPATAADRWALIALWAREARMLGSALLVRHASQSRGAAVTEFVERLGPPLFLSGGEPLDLTARHCAFEIAKPPAAERAELWRDALGTAAERVGDAVDIAAAHYRLGPAAIARMSATVREAVERGDDGRARLLTGCRARAAHDLDGLAQRLAPAAAWNDIVLPADAVAALREIAAQVRHRHVVYDTWGFAAQGGRGLGISALFSGVSGTGKTMAAEVLATDLGLELYRIDLSAVVSKYIGETEKNLRRVFDAAEDTGVILFFDEADALFGKRSEVRDSHDRYANVEISYLLQRMEAYGGLAILATNARSALDPAFMRRLRFVVSFPFPDDAARRDIWQRVFPPAMPQGAIDIAKLARLNVAGGSIRNIAVNAAFAAAERSEAVAMPHLAHAARREFAKSNRVLTDSDTAGWTP